MVRDGIYYALALGAGGGVLAWLAGPAAGSPLFLLAVFSLYFFRDPERTVPAGALAVSPADGKVVAVRQDAAGETRLSIFLSIFDVHVNRSPIAGSITGVRYRPGRFLAANREAASVENEQNSITVEGEGTRIVFNQIAGVIARRVVFFKKPGDVVAAGERVGLIKFGSRVDVFLGPEWVLEVKAGQRVKAGSSVLARRKEAGA
ncbi:MAG: phosphatidylserine decarboxylase family protein [Bryobacterales bacterium]|nr:phosphatidylserine decarboxylase family protein [Bryobacterales bacterium]